MRLDHKNGNLAWPLQQRRLLLLKIRIEYHNRNIFCCWSSRMLTQLTTCLGGRLQLPFKLSHIWHMPISAANIDWQRFFSVKYVSRYTDINILETIRIRKIIQHFDSLEWIGADVIRVEVVLKDSLSVDAVASPLEPVLSVVVVMFILEASVVVVDVRFWVISWRGTKRDSIEYLGNLI